MKQIKLTEQELNDLKALRNRKRAVKEELSEIGFLEIRVKNRKTSVEEFYNQTTKLEVEVAKTLEEKYGKGSIDIESGTFTPIT